jgi:DNA-binding SARP family transcriptional activator
MGFKKTLTLLVSILLSNWAYGQLAKPGLYFHTRDRNIDERTSLVLNNNEPYQLSAQDEWRFDFDFFLRNTDKGIKFGYIFRIISNSEKNFDLIINNESNTFLIIKNRDFQLKDKLPVEQWNHASIIFNKKQDYISLRLNDEIIDCPCDLKDVRDLRVGFGACEFKNFETSDVAPIILKDIKVFHNGKEWHRWILDKHGKNVVYDVLKNKPAIVHNPYWLMDNHVFWKKAASFQSLAFPQFTFDPANNIVYILDSSQLVGYSLSADTAYRLKSAPNVQGKFYNHLTFDPASSRLMYYNMENEAIYYYNSASHVWDGYESSDKEPAHAHHNRYASVKDKSFYLFGGYGFYKYNSDFYKVNPAANEWKLYDFSHTITPRYLAAMGGNTNGDKLYILGGRGAEMGRQELSPRNFADLFEINPEMLSAKYLFDISPEGEGEDIYSNSLIVDREDKNLYVLAYPNKTYKTDIVLKKINLKKQSVEVLGDSIAFYFQDITSFCDLYYSPELSKLIAVAAHSDDSQTSQVNIYTLDFPPLKASDILQTKAKKTNAISYLFAFGSALLFVSAFLGMIRRKRKRNRLKSNPIIPASPTEKTIEDASLKEKNFYVTQKSSILFLGGFEVFSKNGKNITGIFTPTLKYMLCLIVLSTLKNNKGISSSRLQELLWFDKSEEAARNNRSVNLRKLRVLLQEVGDIDINNQNSYWTISLPDNVLSDYKEVLRLAGKIQDDEITEKEDLMRLLELLSYGNILPNIQLEWVDNFKTDFSNIVIDTLTNILSNKQNSFYENPDIQLKIADSLLKNDSINEEAIRIKCKAFIEMGKKGLAKTTFDNFSREYKSLLGEPYSGSIKNFLE